MLTDSLVMLARYSIVALTMMLACADGAFGQPGGADTPAPDARPNVVQPPEPPAPEKAAPEKETPGTADVRESICLMIESAARSHDLPLEFFARVIWQESRFNSDAVGPRTRSGDKAQGIAQFMPRTAAERGLLDPFDPVQALPKSAEFLRELRDRFGNLGLAAAAYNAGPGRVSAYVAKRRGLPEETRNYVIRITGKTADKWTSKKFAQAPEAKVMPAKAPCVEVAQEVAEQVRTAQLANLALAQAAKQSGKLPRALNTVRTALRQVKGKAVIVLAAAKKPAAAPIKLADRIVPDKSAAHGGSAVSQKAGKTSANKTPASKTSVAKASQKPVPASKRTRVASAR